MSSKRIEQLINEIYEYIEGCKPKGFSSTQVIVQKEEVFDILDEMRLKIPDEIKRCQKMISQRDAIMAEAQRKADEIVEQGRAQAEALVNESEVMRAAYLKANQIMESTTSEASYKLQQAEYEANQIRNDALAYTSDMLGRVQYALQSTYYETKEKTDAMMETLKSNLDVITNNYNELVNDVAPGIDEEQDGRAEENAEGMQQEPQREEDGFEIDSDSFMKHID